MNQIRKIGQMLRPYAEILADFNKPVDPKLLDSKPIFKNEGGTRKKVGSASYMHWYTIARELNRICPGWSWEAEPQLTAGRCVVKGRLTIRASEGEFYMEAIGVESLDSNTYGDPVYSAEASAMRRCASRFGLALELWDKEEKKRVGEPAKKPVYSHETKSKYQNNQTKVTTVNNSQKVISEGQVNRLYAIAKKESGLEDEDVKAIIKIYANYTSTKDIIVPHYDPIIEKIKEAGRFVTIAQRKQLAKWWKNTGMSDDFAKQTLSRMGYESTAQILRNGIEGVENELVNAWTSAVQSQKAPVAQITS